MSTDNEDPKPNTPDIGTLGDHKQTPNTVLTHDQIKKRCARYFTKIIKRTIGICALLTRSHE